MSIMHSGGIKMYSSRNIKCTGCSLMLITIILLLDATIVAARYQKIHSSGDFLMPPPYNRRLALINFKNCWRTCYKKFSIDDMTCLQEPECTMCWDDCALATDARKSIVGSWTLRVTSITRENSLVSANIAWKSPYSPSDCLVTWEVDGGGLTGNLLTQSSFVELSLMPETKYRIQVTCKHKKSEEISRSQTLLVDTGSALVLVRVPTVPSTIVADSSNEYIDNDLLDNKDIQFLKSNHLFNGNLRIIVEQYKEIILGTGAAICLFIVMLVAVILNKRKSRALDKLPLVDDDIPNANIDVDRLTIHV